MALKPLSAMTHLTAGPDLSAPSYDRHAVDTIKRLQCIRQLITEPQNYQAAGRELLEWCSDSRAFTPSFEPHLLDCLTVVRQCAQKEGYDLDLSYRILAICAANGDKFQPQAAVELRGWSEEIGKALLLKHKSASGVASSQNFSDSSCKAGGSVGTQRAEFTLQTGMQQPMLRKQYSSDGGQMGWPMDGGAPPNARGPNGLSVVTTVWGMTPSSQIATTPHAGAYDNMPMYQRGPAGQHPAGYPAQTQPGFYRQNSIPTAAGPGMAPQYRPQYNPPPNGNPDYQPPPAALSAAAMVAAAATATATATATASMMVQEQHPHFQRQHSHPYGAQYTGQRLAGPGAMPGHPGHPGHPMAGAPGPMPSQQALAYRRPSPYPQGAVMTRKAQQYAPPNGMSYRHMTPQPTPYNTAAGAAHPAQYSHQVRPGMMQGCPPGGYESGAPPPYTAGSPYPHHLQRSAHPHPNQHVPSQPYTAQTGYMMPQQHMADVKPVPLPPTGGEIQLTFPIRDGIILPPFRLEHNLQVSHHVFHLKEQVFQTLMERQDSEVQLKCFHHEDRQQSPNWPASVSISVNGRPLLIDRGERSYHKPLYLKSVCMPGKNTLTISVCACCCSHLFFLQLVHRPTVKSILQGLLKKRFLAAEQCIAKIKANFANGLPAAESDGVEQTSTKISLKCPITFRRIALPARGSECRHIRCFDLEPYLQLNAERMSWRCPVCGKNALLEGLEIDQYMWGIINELAKTDVDEVNIEANADWKPVTIAKEEHNKDNVCAVNNSWMKVYSPSSTNLPSAGSYEAHHNNPMSPYPTPPNSHNSQGSNSIAHFAGGVYDAGFNSPPDFTGPMSNRSDMSENDKRLAVLQRQQSGIASSPQGPASNSQQPPGYSTIPHGGPASNAPALSAQTSNMAPGGPASNAPMSQGPPSNAPASQGPPSNAPPSVQGPPSNAPINTSNHSPGTTELPSDISDLVNNASTDNVALEGLDDVDLLAYLGPQDSGSNSDDKTGLPNTSSVDDDEILALFAD